MVRSGSGRLLQITLLSVLTAILISATVTANNDLIIHFINVGQGDSELIQFNNKNILIDGGEQDMGARVESFLQDQGVSSLDIVVATHPHSDHVGGLITILNDLPVKQVLDSGQAHTTPTFDTFLNLVEQKNIPYKIPEEGQTIDFDPSLKIEVLNPPAIQFNDDLNQNSIVLKVTYNKVSFLLMGDAGFEAENSISASGYNLRSNILKVAHHGSSSASSSTFLSKVKPAISIIEVGAGNDYGHPTQRTLNALKKIGSKVYRTDLNGNIVITTDGQTYSVAAENQSGRIAGATAQTGTSNFTQSSTPITTSSTVSQQFVGSTKLNKYHYPSCSTARKIKPANMIWFISSEDARAHRYMPCGICHPP
jgi:competence protein ComEC